RGLPRRAHRRRRRRARRPGGRAPPGHARAGAVVAARRPRGSVRRPARRLATVGLRPAGARHRLRPPHGRGVPGRAGGRAAGVRGGGRYGLTRASHETRPALSDERKPLMTRTAIVTGAARGIGAVTARRLAQDGLAVAVLDLKEDQAAQTAQAIVADGGRAL